MVEFELPFLGNVASGSMCFIILSGSDSPSRLSLKVLVLNKSDFSVVLQDTTLDFWTSDPRIGICVVSTFFHGHRADTK